MIEKFCGFIVTKIRSKMPEIDDEKAEIITYGIQIMIGEMPKMILLFVLGFVLGIGWYTVLTFIFLLPYRTASGGLHLKSHIGCILGTSVFYYGVVYLSKFLVLSAIQKYILVGFALAFGLIMVTLHAPADTENIPIISKKERKRKKVLSYITLILTLLAGLLVQDNVISNILIFSVIIQTVMLSRLAYILTKNKYGYEVYGKAEATN